MAKVVVVVVVVMVVVSLDCFLPLGAACIAFANGGTSRLASSPCFTLRFTHFPPPFFPPCCLFTCLCVVIRHHIVEMKQDAYFVLEVK